MTCDQRNYEFRKLVQTYANWRILYVNFDVSSWCSGFRHETVAPVVSATLDDFFRKTQLAYENTHLYMPAKQDVWFESIYVDDCLCCPYEESP